LSASVQSRAPPASVSPTRTRWPGPYQRRPADQVRGDQDGMLIVNRDCTHEAGMLSRVPTPSMASEPMTDPHRAGIVAGVVTTATTLAMKTVAATAKRVRPCQPIVDRVERMNCTTKPSKKGSRG